MGFLDILRGKRELKQPAADRLFAMSTAYIKFEMELELTTTGKAAIVFQPLATADFEGIVKDMEEVVNATGEETGTTVTSADDEFGYFKEIAQAVDRLGFPGVLLPTGQNCEDSWIIASGLATVTEKLKFLVALRPGVTPGI